MLLSDKNSRTATFQYWLNLIPYSFILLGIYVLAAVIPGITSFIILPAIWYLYLFLGISIIFIIYMVYTLFIVKRYGWFSTFIFLFIIPCLLLLTFWRRNVNLSLFLGMCLLIFYIFYYYLLRMAIVEWPDE